MRHVLAVRLWTLAGIGALAAHASAQTTLFSNSGNTQTTGLATGAVSDSGVNAPAGFEWSELQQDSIFSANALGGASATAWGTDGAQRLTDDFTVQGAFGWTLHTLVVFAYQPGAAGDVSPFSGINVKIWRGRPGDLGSTVIWGDAATNRLSSTEPTNLFRVFSTTMTPLPPAPDTGKRIWRIAASLGGLNLPPGDYWVDWQLTDVTGSGEAFAPTVIVPGARGRAGANAMQLRQFDGLWAPINDSGKPSSAADVTQELAFQLLGDGISCPADFDGDGFLTGVDFDEFIIAFEAGEMTSDFDRDGFVTGSDFDAYVVAFEQGC